LLGFAFGAGIDPNNINNLACRFKSPCNHLCNLTRRKIPQTVGSFAASIFHNIRSAKFFVWRRLLVKSITRPEDAERCIAAGADGVILSSHGGRQLDSCVSPLEILAETRARISAPILVDSGFRRGSS
jgi:hypothetical protein